jgi:hypothetical protein
MKLDYQLSLRIYKEQYLPRITDWFQRLSIQKWNKQLQQFLALAPQKSIFQQNETKASS